jgi:hypothetical protein
MFCYWKSSISWYSFYMKYTHVEFVPRAAVTRGSCWGDGILLVLTFSPMTRPQSHSFLWTIQIPVRRKKATSARDVCRLSLAYLRRKTSRILHQRARNSEFHNKWRFFSLFLHSLSLFILKITFHVVKSTKNSRSLKFLLVLNSITASQYFFYSNLTIALVISLKIVSFQYDSRTHDNCSHDQRNFMVAPSPRHCDCAPPSCFLPEHQSFALFSM